MTKTEAIKAGQHYIKKNKIDICNSGGDCKDCFLHKISRSVGFARCSLYNTLVLGEEKHNYISTCTQARQAVFKELNINRTLKI